MIAVLEFFLMVFSSVLGACLLMLGLLVVFDLVPRRISHLRRAIMLELLEFIRAPPSFAITDPVVWYGRGNVLYQNGLTLDDTELEAQWERSERALRYLNATLSRC